MPYETGRHLKRAVFDAGDRLALPARTEVQGEHRERLLEWERIASRAE